jgi:hypothetical protein
MYAQIMVKLGHLRPAVMAMVIRLEGSQADMRHHSSDVCCRGDCVAKLRLRRLANRDSVSLNGICGGNRC